MQRKDLSHLLGKFDQLILILRNGPAHEVGEARSFYERHDYSLRLSGAIYIKGLPISDNTRGKSYVKIALTTMLNHKIIDPYKGKK